MVIRARWAGGLVLKALRRVRGWERGRRALGRREVRNDILLLFAFDDVCGVLWLLLFDCMKLQVVGVGVATNQEGLARVDGVLANQH